MPVGTKNLFMLAAGASASAALRLPKLGVQKVVDGIPGTEHLEQHLEKLGKVLSRRRSDPTEPETTVSGRSLVPTAEYAESVAVTNVCQASVAVAVVYDDWGECTEIREEHVIGAGATLVFGTKRLHVGTIMSIAPIKHITVTHASGASQTLEPSVYGIVERLQVAILADGRLAQIEPEPKAVLQAKAAQAQAQA